jgi:MFS family permease
MFVRHLHEKVERRNGRIDHLSAGVFALAIAAVMADLTAISSASALEITVMTVIAIAATAGFVVQERRSPEPMISLKLWGRRTIAAANAASLLSGVTMIGLTTFVPMFVQGVMRQTPLTAGFALSAMVLGWPVGATLSTSLIPRLGPQLILRMGGFMIPLGALAFTLIDAQSSPWIAGCGSALVGFGMGFLSSQSIIVIQEIVDWSERGAVTSAFLFARSLGSTFGATLFGAILNFGLFRAGFAAVSSEELRGLINNTKAADNADALRAALEASLRATFITMFVVALMGAAVTLLIPKIKLKPRAR